MRQLTGQDTIFLSFEGEETVVHIGVTAICDQSTAEGGMVTFKSIKDNIRARLPELPELTQKLCNVPFELDYPFLAYDEKFHLDFHLRHIALPQPGDWRQLCIQVARIMERPLDLSHPLWEMYIIEGLNNVKDYPPGSFAVFFKIHHALVDGAALLQMIGKIFDTTPELRPLPENPVMVVESAPNKAEAMLMAMASSIKRPFVFSKQASEVLPRYLYNRLLGKNKAAAKKKPRTLFNTPISKHRVAEGTSFDLAEFSALRQLVDGATLNDVVLAVCAGALRKYLTKHKGLPGQSLVVGAPVNLNRERKQSSENDIAVMSVELHTNEGDPLKRFVKTVESARDAKAQVEEVGGRELGELFKQIPSTVLALGVRPAYRLGLLSQREPVFNLVVTNVPGPRVPLYFAGAKVEGFYGVPPIVHDMGLVITQLSYNGRYYFGFCSDLEQMPDPEFFAEKLQESYQELLALLKEKKKKKRQTKAPVKPRKAAARKS